MNPDPESKKEALEAFLLGQSGPVDGVSDADLEAAKARLASIRASLTPPEPEAPGADSALPDADLAQFLDGSLSAERREEVILQLNANPGALARLARLYRDTVAATNPEAKPQVIERQLDREIVPVEKERFESHGAADEEIALPHEQMGDAESESGKKRYSP